tara:strand:+ start:2379 stop:2564 length:186 start_codon:yes stop_codon:yes gene_type:complete
MKLSPKHALSWETIADKPGVYIKRKEQVADASQSIEETKMRLIESLSDLLTPSQIALIQSL